MDILSNVITHYDVLMSNETLTMVQTWVMSINIKDMEKITEQAQLSKIIWNNLME